MCWHIRNSVVCQHFFYTISIASPPPHLIFPLKKERFLKSFRFFRKDFLYDRSLIKEQKSLDKFYCIDNGLRGAVLIPQSNDNGKNLENTVFMQLNRNRHPFDKISYYQGNCECDFVMQREENIMQLIQVTWSRADDETREREIKGLLEAAAVTGCNNLLIITNDEEGELVKDGKTIKIMPAWKWLTKGE